MEDDSPLRPGTSAHSDDEIDRYLKEPRESPNNVLQWWVEHQKTYPQLSRMALDYLSIPGMCFKHITFFSCLFLATSVDVERLFSKGCLLLSHVRSCLSVQSIRALFLEFGGSSEG